MLSTSRLTSLLKEFILERGIRKQVGFMETVSKRSIKLLEKGLFSPKNLRDSLAKDDRSFFASNKISRDTFYKSIFGVVQKENKSRKEFEFDRESKPLIDFSGQVHFGRGDNVGKNKIVNNRTNKKDSLLKKLFWKVLVGIAVGVAISGLAKLMGFV